MPLAAKAHVRLPPQRRIKLAPHRPPLKSLPLAGGAYVRFFGMSAPCVTQGKPKGAFIPTRSVTSATALTAEEFA